MSQLQSQILSLASLPQLLSAMFYYSQLQKFALFLSSSLILPVSVGSPNMTTPLPSSLGNEPNTTTQQISSYSKLQYDALIKALPGKVFLPSDPTYEASKTSYFSLQEDNLSPTCIVTPLDTLDVAKAIKALASVYESSSHWTQFAVRGGGHTPWAGSASIEGSAVIDMTSINTVTVSSDQSVTSVGAGAKWSDVYAYLDPKGLTVSGGRAAQVGVGGLTLGGLPSFAITFRVIN